MELFINIFIFPLLKNISLNNLFICILTNCVNVIPISPKFTPPKLFLYFWMQSEKFSCCNAFHGLNYRFYRHHWDTLYQKMNMIIIRTNLCKMYFKPAFNIFTHFYQTLFNLFRQNTSTIFYRTNQMIQQQVLIMALMNMFAHNTNVIQNTNTTPQQADGELYD